MEIPAKIVKHMPYRHQFQSHVSRPMRILYRKRRKTGPETLPVRWVEEIIPGLQEAQKIVGLDPYTVAFSVSGLDSRDPHDREKINKFIIMQYDLLIDKLNAWLKKYKF